VSLLRLVCHLCEVAFVGAVEVMCSGVDVVTETELWGSVRLLSVHNAWCGDRLCTTVLVTRAP
jgi:hypothetical protein